jgi:hypothetical protein
MTYKQTINDFINSRYEHLTKYATTILFQNNLITPTDLISELYIYLTENKEKVDAYIKINRLEGFAVSWMNIQGKYRTSQVNTKFGNRFEELDEATFHKIQEDYDMIYEMDKDEYEIDLMSTFTHKQIENIMRVDGVMHQLNKIEKILFKAYFVENLSYDKIAQQYTFYREKDGKKIKYKSKKSVYTLMKGLKNKIHQLIQDDTTN